MKEKIVQALLLFTIFSFCNASTSEEEDAIDYVNRHLLPVPVFKSLMLDTEVPQWLYELVMGENRSYHQGNYLPVENVTIVDAIKFCNKLSVFEGRRPAYAINGETDVDKWNVDLINDILINQSIARLEIKKEASGYKLPELKDYIGAFSSDVTKAVSSWTQANSSGHTHDIASKQPNEYNFYDLNGNVSEFYMNLLYYGIFGDSFVHSSTAQTWSDLDRQISNYPNNFVGFRIVRNAE